MNLITFKSKGPIVGHDDIYNTGILSRRWALTAESHRDFICIGFQKQLLSKFNPEWDNCMSYFLFGLQKKFKIGYFSDWYDGQHNVIYLGWFFINWSL